MRAPALPSLLLLALVASMTTAIACSNQGEGEFCDSNNGNNDCQEGLQCVPGLGVPAAGIVNRDRCCPVPPAQPTTAACSSPSATVIDASTEAPDGSDLTTTPVAEAGGPSEAGAADGAGDDVSIDSAAVATPDAAPEGGADASRE
jgi:hypothetical protein